MVTASTVLRIVLWGWNVLEHEELDAREVRVAKTAERSPVFVSSCCDSLPAMPGAKQLDSDSGSGSWEQVGIFQDGVTGRGIVFKGSFGSGYGAFRK